MSLAEQFASQLARPHGMVGRLLGSAMDIANQRAVRLAIERLQPRDGERIVDIGCGTGAALKRIAQCSDCALVGIDPSTAMLAAAAKRLGTRACLVEGRLGALPFPDATFDAALALNMLYFCDAAGAMLADLHRVVRPGGRLVAYVTHRATMDRWAFAKAGHHRLFDAAELAQGLEDGGFAKGSIVVHEAPVGPGVRGLFASAVRQVD